MPTETTIRKKYYSCNGSQKIFPFTFPISAETDLVVKVRTDATGAVSTLTLTTDYTVSKTGANWDSGGNVTTVAAYASGKTLVIIRSTQKTQTKDYIEGDDFPAESHEEGLDKLTRLMQERSEELDRSLKAPDTDSEDLDMTLPTSVDRASKWLGFDADGQPTGVQTTPSSVTVTAAAETVLDDATVAAMCDTLGAFDVNNDDLDDIDDGSTYVRVTEVDSTSHKVKSGGVNMGQGLVDNSDAIDVDGIVEQGSGAAELKCKVVEIGVWDMNVSADGDATVSVAHGLTFTDIRSITGVIRNDSNDAYYPIPFCTNTETDVRNAGWDTTNVTLAVRTGGTFDGASFDTDTDYNRGWITIWYEA